MKLLTLGLLGLPVVLAHTTVVSFFVNGQDQGQGMFLRSAPKDKFSFPVEDLNSPNMACGLGSSNAPKRAVSIPDGATLTFKYMEDPGVPDKGPLDPSHKGPCGVYLKRVDSFDASAAGDGWFKIWDTGYENNQWCANKLIDNGGYMTVNLPKGLAGGYYLVRTEILALHNAHANDPQYYISCAQVWIESTGNLGPEETFSIPGYCNKDDKADSWDLYNGADPNDYVPPGPGPAKLKSGTYGNSGSMPEGGKPEGCIFELNNWCGVEVPDWSNNAECWKSAQNCWNQGKVCWESAGIYKNPSCEVWSGKCESIKGQCSRQENNGPKKPSKDITPQRSSMSPPQPLGPTRSPGIPAPDYGAHPALPTSSPAGGVQPYQPYQPAPYEQPPASSSAPAPPAPYSPAPYNKIQTVETTLVASTTIPAPSPYGAPEVKTEVEVVTVTKWFNWFGKPHRTGGGGPPEATDA